MKDKEISQTTKEIISLHKEIVKMEAGVVSKIIECGKKLLAIKGALPHGKFGDWIFQHQDELSQSTANRYMKLAKNSAHMTNLKDAPTIRQAYIEGGIIKEKTKEPKAVVARTGFQVDTANRSSKSAARIEQIKALTGQTLKLVLRRDKYNNNQLKECLRAVQPLADWYNDWIDRKPDLKEVAVDLNENPAVAEAA